VKRFAARHPLLAYLVWGAAEVLVLAAVYHALDRWSAIGYGDIVTYAYFLLLPALMVFPAVLLLTLWRRYAGLGARPLWLLVALIPLHMLACWVAVFAYVTGCLQDASLGDITSGLSDWQNFWVNGVMVAGVLTAGGAALVALLVGLGIARRMFRTGRWEHIEPAPAAAVGPATRSVARHPLLVGALLFLAYLPVFAALFWRGGFSRYRVVWTLSSFGNALYMLWALNLLWPCAVALLLTIARRQCQLSTGTLYGLMPMVVVQFVVQLALATGGLPEWWSAGWHPNTWHFRWAAAGLLGMWTFWSDAVLLAGGVLVPVGVLAGILLGNVVANHCVRSGRWQTSPDRDAVVRQRLTGLVANIAGLAKRPGGRSGEWVLRLLAYASEHPLGTASALWFVHVPFFLLLGGVYRVAWPRRVPGDDPLPAIIHFALVALLAAVVPAAVVLLRRRSGLSVGMLWWLVPVVAYQAFVQTCFLAGARPHLLYHSFPAFTELFAERVFRPITAWEYAAWLSAALALLAALVGLGVGLAIARWKLRTGRWEHIKPVEAADAGGGAP